ncbi:MAG TPA: hypothetical protein VMY39_06955, partial [Planctomycetota bacterium]|nr:hypothetical protein [Planctomycetota bacterium]
DPHCAALVSLIDQRNATIKELTTARVQPRSELLDAALAACGVLTDLAIGNAVAVSEKYARTLRTRLWNAVMDAKEKR